MNPPKKQRHIASLVILLVSLGATFFLLFNRQALLDHVALLQYQPSPEIAAIAARTTMTEQGKFDFYASRPAIESTQVFNEVCGSGEEHTAILGCYANRRIYIYGVTDAQLDGIKEVTAAHEMLHAAYDRMSDDKKRKVNALVEAEYAKLSQDSALAARMAFYAKTEPGERDNELHSIIGTEIAAISPELEAHYKQYFIDRQALVGLYTKYASVFEALKAKADALSAQLTNLAATISQQSEAYNQDVAALNRDINAFNARAEAGDFSSQAEFNARRNALEARADQLARDRQTINNNITLYNELNSQLAATASQSAALNRSIDSSLAPAPSL
jgi:hypothetical protein